jgi:penicillin-binding protein 1B
VVDQPTTFWFNGKPYQPGNFDHTFNGIVTLRYALAHSLNVPTVQVAEMVGYDAVVEMASRAGMNGQQATPAVALGSYEVTPLEAAGAYTIFSNGGQYVKPTFLSLVRSQDGKVLYKNTSEEKPKQVLDARVAYLTTNMMEEVLRSGTAAGIRAKYKFNVPAAGKTGTSHDGWFAGFTSELLCVVWVGFDDNTTIDLEGAHSAAPIWAEFMKRALNYREYRDAKAFRAPTGIVSLDVDPLSGMSATPACPTRQAEVYIAGTEPVGVCPLHGGRGVVATVAGWETSPPSVAPPAAGGGVPTITGSQGDGQLPPDSPARRAARQAAGQPPSASDPPPPKEEPKNEKKKGFFQRLIRVFK